MTPFKKYWDAKMQKDGAYFSEDQARFYAAELLLAVEEAHSKNIAHRDVRMDNLLLDQDGHLILADFGAAWDKARCDFLRQWRKTCPTMRMFNMAMYRDVSSGLSLGCGLSTCPAPTTGNGVGAILLQMLCNQTFPFDPPSCKLSQRAESLLTFIHTNRAYSPVADNIANHAYSTTKFIEKIKQHNFFQDIDWEKLAKKQVPAITHISEVTRYIQQHDLSEFKLSNKLKFKSHTTYSVREFKREEMRSGKKLSVNSIPQNGLSLAHHCRYDDKMLRDIQVCNSNVMDTGYIQT